MPKKQPVRSLELSGGPFCGLLVVPAKRPEQVLLLSPALLPGLLDPVLEKAYAARTVRYELTERRVNGTRAVYICTGTFKEVGRVEAE